MGQLGCWACLCGLSLAASVWGSNEAVTMSVAFTPEVGGSPSVGSLPEPVVEGSPLSWLEVNRIGSAPMEKLNKSGSAADLFVDKRIIKVGKNLFCFRNLTQQFKWEDLSQNGEVEEFARGVDDKVIFEARVSVNGRRASALVVRVSHLLFLSESGEWQPCCALGEEQPRYLANLVWFIASQLMSEKSWPHLIVMIGESNIMSIPADLLKVSEQGASEGPVNGQGVSLVGREKLQKEFTYFWLLNFLSSIDSPKIKDIFQRSRECYDFTRCLLAVACKEEPALWGNFVKKHKSRQSRFESSIFQLDGILGIRRSFGWDQARYDSLMEALKKYEREEGQQTPPEITGQEEKNQSMEILILMKKREELVKDVNRENDFLSQVQHLLQQVRVVE